MEYLYEWKIPFVEKGLNYAIPLKGSLGFKENQSSIESKQS